MKVKDFRITLILVEKHDQNLPNLMNSKIKKNQSQNRKKEKMRGQGENPQRAL